MKAHRLAAWLCGCTLLAVVGGSSCKSNNINATTNNYNTAEIGPAGGTIDGPDGVTVIFAAGAVPQTTSFTIGKLDSSAAPAPPAGYSYVDPSKVYYFTPHGFTFAGTVTVDLPGATTQNVFHANCPASTAEGASDGCTWDPSPVTGVANETFGTTSFSLYTLVTPTTASEGGAVTNSVMGSVDGVSLTINQAAGIYGTVNGGSGITFNVAGFVFSDSSTNQCTRIQSGASGWEPGHTILAAAALVPSGGTVMPGTTYPIVASTEDAGSTGIAQSIFARFDSSCNTTPSKSPDGGSSDNASGGTLTIGTVDLTGMTLTGSFNLVFDGSTISGTFSVPICNQMDLSTIFSCSGNDAGAGVCCG